MTDFLLLIFRIGLGGDVTMYFMARKFWDVSRWIWLTLVFTFLIGLAANLAVVQTTDLHKTVVASILNWFTQFGIIQTVLLILFGLFIALTLLSLIIISWENTLAVAKYCENTSKQSKKHTRALILKALRSSPL